MSFASADLIQLLVESRQHFLKHAEGLKSDQWTWKPYPECKSIAETMAHLVTDDRAALASLESGSEPDYDSLQVTERIPSKLIGLLEASHQELIGYIKSHFANESLDKEISVWGNQRKLGAALAYFQSEDFYHAGQVAFIRMATDPAWNYYEAIYS